MTPTQRGHINVMPIPVYFATNDQPAGSQRMCNDGCGGVTANVMAWRINDIMAYINANRPTVYSPTTIWQWPTSTYDVLIMTNGNV